MNRINLFERKSKRVKTFKRLLMMMAAIMMAFATLTSCDEDEDPSDDPDEIENGENGGVAGKRIKTLLQTTGPADGPYRLEFSYNSDGSIKQVDYYDESSKHVGYNNVTCNADGTVSREKFYWIVGNSSNFELNYDWTYTYGSDKKPTKAEIVYYYNTVATENIVYTFQNGRQTRQVWTSSSGQEVVSIQYDFNYDNKGKRTTTTETHSMLGTRQTTRTYNSDGTLQKVTYPNGYNGSDNTIITKSFTWEDGKTNYNYDDIANW